MNTIQGWIMLACFIGIIGLVVARVRVLRSHGVKAFLFGATQRSDLIIFPLVLLGVYLLTTPATGWPNWPPLVTRWWNSGVPGWVGVALGLAAVIGLAWTLVVFGDSFRVGIDESRPGRLVTSGPFALSRNPIYVCFAAFIIGVFLTQANAVAAAIVLLFLGLVNRQIRREERFLAGRYGAEFDDYTKAVRRWV
ncbi:MAG: isoprenylcysteine carboxylmethyltransferase family protein [Propionibacteriaceae bacterium]|jgi:protein-S-isoprenylcysteine O-methyltransferase Ste14|nr:isoprenylcysteine carboxylmethyltransferase family protein [Propionibacteriaceae bacterium]